MRVGNNRDDVYFSFSKSQSCFDSFNQARASFLRNRDSILNDLNARTESFDLFWIDIHAHDFVVDPDAQITLLLEELEKLSRLGFGRNCDPKRDQNIFAGAIAQDFVGD